MTRSHRPQKFRGPIVLISEAVLIYLYSALTGCTSRWKTFLSASATPKKSLWSNAFLRFAKPVPDGVARAAL